MHVIVASIEIGS